MPRATCRCGQKLSFPADGPDRVICPKCSAKIRVRQRDAAGPVAPEREGPGQEEGDGFVRFACECGRRLKVRLATPLPEAGQCPDCGRVVPVPASAIAAANVPPTSSGLLRGSNSPESPTQEMSATDLATLDRWAAGHRAKVKPGAAVQDEAEDEPTPARVAAGNGTPAPAVVNPRPAPVKVEAGLRVCPRCGRPIHLGADTCRQCGAHVPKR